MTAPSGGPVSLVTGGARGIGQAIAIGLSQSGPVYVFDLASADETVEEIRAAGGIAESAIVDITRPEDIGEGITRCIDEFGSLDVVVNNVGWTLISPFLEEDETYWRKLIDINYMGTVLVCHEAARAMVAQGSGGRIINIGSDAGRVGQKGEAVYAGAKGAVIAFSKSLARELASDDILVNCVCPGPTDTPLNRSLSERMMNSILRHSPLGRLARPEEVAAAVVFLAQPEASFLTGQVISVSGGLTMVG